MGPWIVGTSSPTAGLGEPQEDYPSPACPALLGHSPSIGALVGVAARRKFGEIDTKSRSLTQLFCAERAGLIFVSLSPGVSVDIEH